ncbi:MAG: hypothetical protein JSR77_11440 [Planctomycetes bacterium]|nr:hypothetical protein [Planctomycetota bacterium]
MRNLPIIYSRQLRASVEVRVRDDGMWLRHRFGNEDAQYDLEGEFYGLYVHDSGLVCVAMGRHSPSENSPKTDSLLELIVIRPNDRPRVAYEWNRTPMPQIPGVTSMTDCDEPVMLKLLCWDGPCQRLGVLLHRLSLVPGSKGYDVHLALADIDMAQGMPGGRLQFSDGVPIDASRAAGPYPFLINASEVQGTSLLLLQWEMWPTREPPVSEFELIDIVSGRVVWQLPREEQYQRLATASRIGRLEDFRMRSELSQIQGGRQSFVLRSQDMCIERVFRVTPTGEGWSSVSIIAEEYREMHAPPHWSLLNL